MSNTQKIHVNFDLDDAMEKKAYEILCEVKKTGIMKRFVAEAVLLADRMKRGEQKTMESLCQTVDRHEQEIQYISKSVGVILP